MFLKETLGKLAEKWTNLETCKVESGIESSVESGCVFLLAVLENKYTYISTYTIT